MVNIEYNIIKLLLMLFLLSNLAYSTKIEYSENTKISLNEFINKANPFDSVIIKKSIIFESGIIIDKPLFLVGIGNPIIDAQSKGGTIISVNADNVKIFGITLKNVERTAVSDNAAIKYSNAKFGFIENCTVENGFFGLYFANSQYCTINGNTVLGNSVHESNSGNGIHLWKCKNMFVTNNTIFRQRDGIYFEFVKNGTILNNYSEQNLRYGLHFMFSDSCKYIANTFKNNGAGVAVMYTKVVLMENNNFLDNWGPTAYGLLIKDINDSKIIGNKFLNNTVGIYAEGSNRAHIERNEFRNNGWAFKIMANCNDNNINRNNFISNTFDVATNSRQNYSFFKGNYWSSYSGYDLNKDGVGDIPYHPVRLFSLLSARQSGAMILLHSFFIEILDLAERIFPFLTPATLIDSAPQMKVIT